MEDADVAASDEPRLPCDKCPEIALQHYLDSPAGRLIGPVIDLDAALQAGMTITLGEVTYLEFLVLRQLWEERDKFTAEESQRKR